MVRLADDKVMGVASVIIGACAAGCSGFGVDGSAAAGQRPLCPDESGAACWL